ncbi:MAG: hypothetical protein KO316_09185 [Methanobacterium sp.]|jgi:hypothetical protein|nr:hypothetical protein [Methanobacterium sp.]
MDDKVLQRHDKYAAISVLGTFSVLFLKYLSSGNPGYFVFCLGMIGLLISIFKLYNSNRVVYYVALLCVLVVQTILLINMYLVQMIYLQNNEQYLVCAFGVFAYIVVVVLLFKPNVKGKSQPVI